MIRPTMAGSRRFYYYGWVMVAAGFVCYGFGLSPAYNSWGFYGPELVEDLGLSRAQIGSVFGLFGLMYSFAAPASGAAIGRWGLRLTMSLGSMVAAAGFYLLSRATSVWDCYLGFSIVGGIGIGLSSQLPCQTIASLWFRRYRARAMAIIISGGGFVGVGVPYFNRFMLEQADWRSGWEWIALTSVGVGVFAYLVVRDRPESVGLEVDGGASSADAAVVADAHSFLHRDHFRAPARTHPTREGRSHTRADGGLARP